MRPHALVLGSLVLVLSSSPLFAQGIDLSWNECIGGPNAATNRNITCLGATNQTYLLAFQYKSPVNIPGFIGLSAFADLVVESPGPLSPFWHYETGGCNRPGISISDALPASCAGLGFGDTWDGDGTGGFEGIAAYGADFLRPGMGRLILGVARADASPITASANMFAFHLTFNNVNRQTCFGCTQRVLIVWQVINLESDDGSPAVVLTTPDKGTNCVTINGASIAACGVVPSHNATWTQIKGLYR
jgi:hypothetical protein